MWKLEDIRDQEIQEIEYLSNMNRGYKVFLIMAIFVALWVLGFLIDAHYAELTAGDIGG